MGLHGLPPGLLPAHIPQDSLALHCLGSSPVRQGLSKGHQGLQLKQPWTLGATPGPCQGERDSLDPSSLQGRVPAPTAAPLGGAADSAITLTSSE